jgi:hypothetical protein
MVATGATVADAAADWLRWAEHDRACKAVDPERLPADRCADRT